MITCRSWSQETRPTFPWVWPLNYEPADLQADAVAWLLIVQSTQKHGSEWFMSVFFALLCHAEMCFKMWNHLPFNIFSFFSPSQSPEQKQTPVSPRASLPVQPQTRTTVSAPFMFFHLSLQSSDFPQLSHRFLCPSLSLLMCYVIHLKTQPRCNVRTFIRVEGSSPAPGDTVPLCPPVERWKTVSVCVCVHGCKR